MGNHVKTAILLTALTALLLVLGGWAGGRTGIIIAFFVALGLNFFSYWYSDRIVLSLYRAREVSREDAPEVHRMVEELSQKAGLPMPRLYVVPGPAPNAFATGRDPAHSAVAVTEGILRLVEPEELKGVLAHELNHIRNRDTLISTLAATLAGAIMLLASMARWAAIFGGMSRDDDGDNNFIALIAMAIVAPVAALLIQMAISRSREYLADEGAAELTGNPNGLASALNKLAAYSEKIPLRANPSTSHLFIVNPLSGGGFVNLFATHPPIAQRIRRLRNMAG